MIIHFITPYCLLHLHVSQLLDNPLSLLFFFLQVLAQCLMLVITPQYPQGVWPHFFLPLLCVNLILLTSMVSPFHLWMVLHPLFHPLLLHHQIYHSLI